MNLRVPAVLKKKHGKSRNRKKKPDKKPEKKTNPSENRVMKDSKKTYPAGSGTKSFNRDEFIETVNEENTMMGIHLEKAASITENEAGIVISFRSKSINYNYLTRPAALKTLKQLAGNIYNLGLKIELEESAENQSKSENGSGNETVDINSDPVVKEALNIFEGRIISTKYKNKE